MRTNPNPNTAPAISIIVPIYNTEVYLNQCIDSILNQVFQDWELILINDGSKDRCGAICDEYAQQDSRIKVLHKANSGLSDCRNIALETARGKYIGYVDSDDWIEPDMYKILYEALLTHNADISICGYFQDYRDRSQPFDAGGDVALYDNMEALKLILDGTIRSFAWNKLYRKEVITHPFPKSYYFEDHATLFRWFANAARVVHVNEPKYHYRQRQGSICSDTDPKKIYHYLLAEQLRYEFVQSNEFLRQQKVYTNSVLAKSTLWVAKKIARNAQKYTCVKEHLKQIGAGLQAAGLDGLSLKERIQKWELVYLPRYFFYKKRFSKKIHFGKKKQNNYY